MITPICNDVIWLWKAKNQFRPLTCFYLQCGLWRCIVKGVPWPWLLFPMVLRIYIVYWCVYIRHGFYTKIQRFTKTANWNYMATEVLLVQESALCKGALNQTRLHWVTYCRRHFEMHFCKGQFSIPILISLKVVKSLPVRAWRNVTPHWNNSVPQYLRRKLKKQILFVMCSSLSCRRDITFPGDNACKTVVWYTVT